jgi:hypothetical protein
LVLTVQLLPLAISKIIMLVRSKNLGMADPCCQFVRGVIVLVASSMDIPTVIHSPISLSCSWLLRRAPSRVSSLAAEWSSYGSAISSRISRKCAANGPALAGCAGTVAAIRRASSRVGVLRERTHFKYGARASIASFIAPALIRFSSMTNFACVASRYTNRRFSGMLD